MKNTQRFILMLLAPLLCASLFGQTKQNDSINFNRIQFKKLTNLLEQNHLFTKNDLKNIEVACYSPGDDSGSYSSHTKTFLIKADIETVWNAYKTVSPTSSGNKKDVVGFGMLYGEKRDKIYYLEDAYDGMEEGQLVFWNLRLAGGLIKISVGQRINRIDDEAKFFEICYLAPGISHGSQYIQLYPTEEGYTQVVHYTRFRSGSKFRDRRLYPGLHEKAIDEFHESIRKSVEEKVLKD